MTACVLDASVAVEWYVSEIHSAEASKLLDNANDLHVPDLACAEFGNVLWKKVNRGELSRDEAGDILVELAAVPLGVHVSAPILSDALGIAHPFHEDAPHPSHRFGSVKWCAGKRRVND